MSARKFFTFLTVCSPALLFAASSALALGENFICIKDRTVISSATLRLPQIIKATTSGCPKGFKRLASLYEPASTLSSIRQTDGVGSGLDADLLDGLTSGDFAAASDVVSLQSSVAALQSSLSTLNTSTTSHTTELASHSTRLDSLETATTVQHVIHVGTSGGDYNSLATAIAAISDSSIGNPYVVILGAGVFTLNSALTIPAGVRVRGEGPNISIIRGSVPGTSYPNFGLVYVANGASISDLSIENTASTSAAGINLSGGTETDGTNIPSIDTSVDNVRILLSGTGGNQYGILAKDSDAIVHHVQVELNGTTASNSGISVDGGHVYVDDSNIHAAGATGNLGASCGSGFLTVRNSDIYGATYAVAVSNVGTLRISGSRLHSPVIGIGHSGAGANLFASFSVINAVDNINGTSSGTISCTYMTDNVGTAFPNSCE